MVRPNGKYQSHSAGRLIAAICVFILATSSGVPTYAADEERGILVVHGARDVWEHHLDETYWQISYTINLAYPSRAVGKRQWDQLRKAGWSRCRHVDPGMEAANSDWGDFIDATVSPNRLVHQHLTNWLKGDRMIAISLRYYSATLDRSSDAVPDNMKQHVDIIFDEDPKGRDSVAALGLDCSQ